MTVHIRSESGRDIGAIRYVTELAFRDMPYASGDEQDIVDRLRDAGALAVSLVAVVDETVVGHVAFSPARSSDGFGSDGSGSDGSGPWFTLGPVSVHPEHQRKGVGSALIRRGLAEIRRRGARGCILVGDPGYYRRFGFEVSPANSPEQAYAEYFMILCFAAGKPRGSFAFHEAFSAES